MGPDEPLSVKHSIRAKDKTLPTLHFDCKMEGDSCTVVFQNDSQKAVAITDGPSSEMVKVLLETGEERNHGWAGLCDALHALHVVVRSHARHKWAEIDADELNGGRGSLVVDLGGGVLHEGVYSEFELRITIERGQVTPAQQKLKAEEEPADAGPPSGHNRPEPVQPGESAPPAEPGPEQQAPAAFSPPSRPSGIKKVSVLASETHTI